MSSTFRSNLIFPNGGIRRDLSPQAIPLDSYWDLLDLRPLDGRLVQRPRYAVYNLPGTGTEKNATAFVVPTTALDGEFIFVRDTSVVNRSVAYPIWLLTALPSGESINTGLLTVPTTAFDANFANTDTLDIEMTSATQFHWRKNGGAYSAAVTVVTGAMTTIAGLELYWLTTTGFTIGHKWSYKRDDAFTGITTITRAATPMNDRWTLVGTDAYFFPSTKSVDGYDTARPLFRLRNGVVAQAGYRPIYGNSVGVFQNHLMITGYTPNISGTSPGDSYNYLSYTGGPFQLGWSDLNNPDNVIPTDTNEADVYTIPSDVSQLPIAGITAAKKLRDRWYTYTPSGIFETTYVGLPNVMITTRVAKVGCYGGGVIELDNFHYFIGFDGIYRFDGVNVVLISQPVRDFLPVRCTTGAGGSLTINYSWLSCHLDTKWSEVSFCVGTYCLVYDTLKNRWHRRTYPPSLQDGCSFNYFGVEFYFRSSGINYFWEVNTITTDPLANDITGGSGYSQPYAELGDAYFNSTRIKDFDRIFFDAVLNNPAGVTTTTSLQISHSARSYSGETVSFTDVAVKWVANAVKAVLGQPRIANRVIRYKFTFVGDCPAYCELRAYEIPVRDGGAQA